MFTVKLCKGHSTKLVQSAEVNVFASLQDNNKKPIGVAEIDIPASQGDGRDSMAFYIADRNRPRPKGFAATVEFYDVAYIENQHGATTQVVRAPAL